MANATRELLLTNKAATEWQANFEAQIDGLIGTINLVDNQKEIDRSTELMDVYDHKKIQTGPARNRRLGLLTAQSRPFEFLTFRN